MMNKTDTFTGVERDRVIEIIRHYKNPYPKDIFLWDNNEELNFNRGRFNKFIHSIIENMRIELIERIKEDK